MGKKICYCQIVIKLWILVRYIFTIMCAIYKATDYDWWENGLLRWVCSPFTQWKQKHTNPNHPTTMCGFVNIAETYCILHTDIMYTNLPRLPKTVLICTNSKAWILTHQEKHTNKTWAHVLSEADSWLPELSIWFHMAISSITAYNIWDGQLLLRDRGPCYYRAISSIYL